MKKLIMCLMVAGTFTTTAVAQDATGSLNKTEATQQMKDCVIMKDGKMIEMNKAGTTTLVKDLTLANGTVVSADGTVKSADGAAWKLKDGEAVDMDGKLIAKKEQE
jgi:hypothetical protein